MAEFQPKRCLINLRSGPKEGLYSSACKMEKPHASVQAANQQAG